MSAKDWEAECAKRFGTMVREKRIQAALRQVDIALVSGVGRRFVVDLEAGKPGCHLGKALRVAEALGVRFPDIAEEKVPDLPDMDDDDDVVDDRQEDGMRIGDWIRNHS